MTPTACAIGICAAVERARWGHWDDVVTMLPRSYAAAIQAAGAMALLLPPDPGVAEEPGPLLDRLDGLMLAGGADVDPSTYGARAHPETAGANPGRDRFEIALLRSAMERGMPVLGICRGMQILNVALGGTLVQHLPERLGHEQHRSEPGSFTDDEVRLEPGSLAARAAGAERLAIKSHHHQGIEELGKGAIPTGWSVRDQLVEAIELPEHPYALGVLWHPEEDERSRVIGSLVEAARAEVGAA